MPYLIVNNDFKMNPENFSPLRLINNEFTGDLVDQEVEGHDTITGKVVKLGKIVSSQLNCGIALVDLSKVDKLGGNTRYSVGSSHRAIIWSPTWLDIVRKNNE